MFEAAVRRLREEASRRVASTRANLNPPLAVRTPRTESGHGSGYEPFLPRIYRWWREEGERQAVRGALGRVKGRWTEITAGCKLPGLRLARASSDVRGWTLELVLPVGMTVAELQGRLGHLEAAIASITSGRIKVPPDCARLVRDHERAERATLRLVLRDPLRRPQAWPGPAVRSVREPIPLGPAEDGSTVELAILPKDGEGRNVLIGGMKGSGKSSLMQVLVGSLINCTDVVVWVIDLKFGVEFRWAMDCVDRLVSEVDEATAILEAAMRIVAARGRQLRARAWHATAEEPLLVIVIDEFQGLGAVQPQKDAEGRPKRTPMELVYELARLGRAVGVQLVLATQRPSADALGQGGTGLRSQCDVQIAMRVARQDEAALVLGPGSTSEGWRPDRFHEPGYYLLRGLAGFEQPRPARCYLVSDRQLEQQARGCGQRARPALDEASALAVAEADQGDQGRDRDRALRIALQMAPTAGQSIRELANAAGLPRTWVHERVRQLVAAGEAVQASRGYRAAPTSTESHQGGDGA